MISTQICLITDCDKPIKTKKSGFCNAHYLRWLRHGDPLAGGTVYGVPKKWMLDHVNYDKQDCLIWPFSPGAAGYGNIRHNGANITANNYVCRLAHGEPPAEKPHALHSCRNGPKGCVNPSHLRWGSHSENMADRVADGTTNRGEQQWQSRLTENDVLEIRNRLSNGDGCALIAVDYEVSRYAINDIRTERRWSWLT